jgi:hypothetical protein
VSEIIDMSNLSPLDHSSPVFIASSRPEDNRNGVCSRYLVIDNLREPDDVRRKPDGSIEVVIDSAVLQEIVFQNGPSDIVGVTGVTTEVLLKICAHRLTAQQEGTLPCEESVEALALIEKAVGLLDSRTFKRWEKGVLGKEVAVPSTD